MTSGFTWSESTGATMATIETRLDQLERAYLQGGDPRIGVYYQDADGRKWTLPGAALSDDDLAKMRADCDILIRVEYRRGAIEV